MNKSPLKPTNSFDTSLFLICEELKSRRFFYDLEKSGFTESYFQPHLDIFIINSIGLDESDQTFHEYSNIMDKYSQKLEANERSVKKYAMMAYGELRGLVN